MLNLLGCVKTNYSEEIKRLDDSKVYYFFISLGITPRFSKFFYVFTNPPLLLSLIQKKLKEPSKSETIRILRLELSKVEKYPYGSLRLPQEEWQQRWESSPEKRVLLYAYCDYSGSFFKWAEAINRYTEYAARLVVLHPHQYDYPLDLVLPFPNSGLPSGLEQLVSEANIIHIKDEIGFFNGSNGLPSDLFSRFKKPMVFTHYGGFARKFSENREYIKYVNSYDSRVSMTPDLIFPWFKGRYIPHSVDTDKYLHIWKDGKIVAHSPSTKARKGTIELEAALKNLPMLSYNLIHNVSHKESIERKSGSSLFFDQAGREIEKKLGISKIIGWYGNSAIEATAFGVPTIAHLSDNSFEGAARAGHDLREKCAIINTPIGAEGIQKTLEYFFFEMDDAARAECSLRTRLWTIDFHSYQSCAKELAQVYDGLI